MGTEKEQREEFSWEMRGPDGDGCCWLEIDTAGDRCSFNLGNFDAVGDKLCAWLAENDFGDRPCNSASSSSR